MFSPEPIPPLSPRWLLDNGVGLTLSVVFLVAVWRSSPARRELLVRALSALLLVRVLWYYPYLAWIGGWTPQNGLPLHFSAIAVLMGAAFTFVRHPFLYEMLLFWGVTGGLQSLLTPMLPLGAHGGVFEVDYFVTHYAIITLPIAQTAFLGYRPRPGAWWRVWAFSQLLVVSILAVNVLLDANYMYLLRPPPVKNPLVQGQWPTHLVLFEVAGLIQWGLMHALVRWLTRGREAQPSSVTSNRAM